MSPSDSTIYDIAVLGGGLGGCGIARAAAGRGWTVLLCDPGDLGGTPSPGCGFLLDAVCRSDGPSLRLLREGLAERDILAAMAPHAVQKLPLVLPFDRAWQPRWRLRLGMAWHERIHAPHLPRTRSVRLREDAAGPARKPGLWRALRAVDHWADMSRLALLNAKDAAAHGATILPRTRLAGASRGPGGWTLQLRHSPLGTTHAVRARTMVDAAGPCADGALARVAGAGHAGGRLVKWSTIVLRRLYPGPQAYVLAGGNEGGMFATPYERDFTLVSGASGPCEGDPAETAASREEVAMLCHGASVFFQTPVTPAQVLWTFCDVRAAGAGRSEAAIALDAAGAPLLSAFGGAPSRYRRSAEAALERLSPFLPASAGLPPNWTATAALPGGAFPAGGFDGALASLRDRYGFIPEATLRRLLCAYGTLAEAVLDGAKTWDALGRVFGADLTEAEVRYLARAEWAVTAADILWRRSKLGLRFTAQEVARLDAFMTELHPEQDCVA